MSEINEDLVKIAKHYGLEHQGDKLCEECAEVIQAWIKFKHDGLEKTEYKWSCYIQELADLSNVFEQMVYLMNCEKDISEISQSKIERTVKEIEIRKNFKGGLSHE